MRVLHPGRDHDCGGPAGEQPRSDRGGDPSRDRGELLPLHRLPEHRRRRSGSQAAAATLRYTPAAV
jgi:hypothetical protein